MAYTDQQVRDALAKFPDATPEQLLKAMANYGVPQEQYQRVINPVASPSITESDLYGTSQDINTAIQGTNTVLQATGSLNGTVIPAIPGPLQVLLFAADRVRNLNNKRKLERQKNENLRLLTLDEMAKAGIDPFAIYEQGKVDSDIDSTEQAEIDLAQEEMDGLNPPQDVAEGYAAEQAIEKWREDNLELMEGVYNDFLASGLDYDEYKKRLEQDKLVEEVSLEPDPDLTPQETFAGLEEEQKIGRINDALEKNPNATLADILDILTSWNIPTDLFRKATGKTPEEYVAKGDGGGNGEEEPSPEECQPGYEKWNGSCVPVCNAAAGYVRDEATGQCVLKEETPEPTPPEPCPEGYVYDEASQSCVPIKKKGGEQQCPIGQEYDETLQKCVPIKKKDTGGGDLNDPTETPITDLPKKPTTEPAQGGMFAVALSPSRTTSEVLAPDLFKLDKNIPLIGRLTQATPLAAPQYLLSGISQRYGR